MDDLLDLRRDITDAIDTLKHAARMAYSLSGYEPGRQPCEWTACHPCPSCNGSGYERPEVPLPDGIPWPNCPACLGKAYYETTHADPGEPAGEGWSAMIQLSDSLDALAAKVDEAFTQEIREACEAEAQERDRLSDMADGRSY